MHYAYSNINGPFSTESAETRHSSQADVVYLETPTGSRGRRNRYDWVWTWRITGIYEAKVYRHLPTQSRMENSTCTSMRPKILQTSRRVFARHSTCHSPT